MAENSLNHTLWLTFSVQFTNVAMLRWHVAPHFGGHSPKTMLCTAHPHSWSSSHFDVVRSCAFDPHSTSWTDWFRNHGSDLPKCIENTCETSKMGGQRFWTFLFDFFAHSFCLFLLCFSMWFGSLGEWLFRQSVIFSEGGR